MTYIADLDPNNPVTLSREAYAELFEVDTPDWREREAHPERFVSEADFFAIGPELDRTRDREAFGGFHNP